jgi:hypothetical protein
MDHTPHSNKNGGIVGNTYPSTHISPHTSTQIGTHPPNPPTQPPNIDNGQWHWVPHNTNPTPPTTQSALFNCKLTLKSHSVFACDQQLPHCIIIKFKIENQKVVLTSHKSKQILPSSLVSPMSLQPLMDCFPYSSPNQPNKLTLTDIVVQIDDQQIKYPISIIEIYHTANPRIIPLTNNYSWMIWASNCRSKATGIKSWVVNGSFIQHKSPYNAGKEKDGETGKEKEGESIWSMSSILEDDES